MAARWSAARGAFLDKAGGKHPSLQSWSPGLRRASPASVVESPHNRAAPPGACIDRRQILLGSTAAVVATPVQVLADLADPGWYTVPEQDKPRTVVITGANSGIGYAAAGKLAAAGCDVYLVCRTQEKAEKACQRVQDMYGPLKGSVHPENCELGSQASIRSFASRWLDSGRTIDVLSLNAGAQFVGDKAPRRTKEGFELTVGVNHLGHFLLANLLLPAVEASSNDPRIVVTASEVHDPNSAGGRVGPGAALGDLSGLKAGSSFDMVSGGPFDADKAYKDSKLCNILFARELDRRLAQKGVSVTVNSFGPGLITRSGFFREAPPVFTKIFDWATNDLLGVAETVQGGGDCLAFMAADPNLAGISGAYFNNDTSGIPLISPGHEFHKKLPSPEAQDREKGIELWELSSKLVGLDA